jgi:hypothetical protein
MGCTKEALYVKTGRKWDMADGTYSAVRGR